MSLSLAHEPLHLKTAVSLTDPRVFLLMILVLILVGEPSLLVMFEFFVFQRLPGCTPLERLLATRAVAG